MISIEHPAWAYQFRTLINMLMSRGDKVHVLAIDKDGDLELLKKFNFNYKLMASSTGSNILSKGWLFFALSITYTIEAIKFKPDVIIGRASPMIAVAAFFKRVPHVFYEDTEVSRFSLRICRMLGSIAITSHSFTTDMGQKQTRVDTYKELFYLSPSCFTPSKLLLYKAGFNPDERYVVVRFISWNASHDFLLDGVNDNFKLKIVKGLEKYARVFISSEAPLMPELEKYRLKTPYELIHHILYYASLVYSEGATMASEAAILGTHAIYVNPITSGSTDEQHSKYDLLYPYHDKARYQEGLVKAQELLENDQLIEMGKQKRKVLLENKPDINRFYINMIDSIIRG